MGRRQAREIFVFSRSTRAIRMMKCVACRNCGRFGNTVRIIAVACASMMQETNWITKKKLIGSFRSDVEIFIVCYYTRYNV